MTLIKDRNVSSLTTMKIMLKKVFVFTILSSLLAACSSGPEGYLKRSANNQIFDRKGFKGGKRPPLYNKKYISQAKKNILNGEYDDDSDLYDDDDDEAENISRNNIEMYKAMIDEDLERGNNYRSKRNNTKRRRNKMAYPSIVEANNKIDPHTHSSNLEMREEMEQIKSMLSIATRDLASYKCPTAEIIEREEKPKSTTTKNKAKQPKPVAIEQEIEEPDATEYEVEQAKPATVKPKLKRKKPVAIEPEIEQPDAIEYELEQPKPATVKPKLKRKKPVAIEPEIEQQDAIEYEVEKPKPVTVKPKLKRRKPVAIEPEIEQPDAIEYEVEQPKPATVKPKLKRKKPAAAEGDVKHPSSITIESTKAI